MNEIPKNLFYLICQYLSGLDLTRSLRVCKKWNLRILANEFLKETMVLHSSITLGERQWRFLGDINTIPKLPEKIKEELEKPCPYFPEKKRYETSLLFLIPNEISKEKFCARLLFRLAAHSTKIEDKNFCWKSHLLTWNEDSGVEHSYWLLATKHLIKETTNKHIYSQKKFLKDNDRLLTPLEALTLLVLNYINSQKNEILFKGEGIPFFSYTITEEVSNNRITRKVLVGYADNLGIHVAPYINVNPGVGLAAAKKLNDK